MMPLPATSPSLLRLIERLQQFHGCVLMLLSQPAKHRPPCIVVERAEDALGSPCVTVECTPSSKQPVQLAKQVMQVLIGAIAPTEPLDPFACPVATLFWDQRDARLSLESATLTYDNMVPEECETFRHGCDERLGLREFQSQLILKHRCTAAFSFSASCLDRSYCCGPGGAPMRSRKSSAYRMGNTIV